MTLRHIRMAAVAVLLTAGLRVEAAQPTLSPPTPLLSHVWYEQPDPEWTAKYVFGSCLGFPKLGQLWLEHPAAEGTPRAEHTAVCTCGRAIPQERTYRVWTFDRRQLRTAWTSYSAASSDPEKIFEFWISFFN